jgi:hypothetical protein
VAKQKLIQTSISVAFTLLLGCSEQGTKETRKFSVEDWLEICSPFFSVDAKEMLTFDANHTVKRESMDQASDTQAKGILEARHERIEPGIRESL